jgi:hypothetical protein
VSARPGRRSPPPIKDGKLGWEGSRQSDAGGTASRQKKKNPKHQKKKKQTKPRSSSPEEAQKKPNQAQAEEAMGGIRLFCWVGFCTLYFVLLAEEAMGSIRQRLELTRAVAVYPSTPKRGEHSRGGHHRPSQLHSFFVCFLGGFVLAGSAGLHVRMICAAPWLPRAVGVVGRWCGMSSWCQNHFGIFPSLFFGFDVFCVAMCAISCRLSSTALRAFLRLGSAGGKVESCALLFRLSFFLGFFLVLVQGSFFQPPSAFCATPWLPRATGVTGR